jgi:diguanylate cyclase (GGDEF)-like protein
MMSTTLFIDLDGFKKVNDTYGHEEGDHLLKKIAEKLSLVKDDCTFVSRLGGDEFTVLLHGADQKRALDKANIIIRSLQTKVRDLTISASVGIALSREGVSPSLLLKKADLAMYEAKSAGKNSVVFD